MNNRQSGFKLMTRLIKVLKPLTPIMMITISFGVLGFLAAIAITSFGMMAAAIALNIDMGVTFKTCIAVIIACGILRGVLRYIEQYSGHYIAFTILAILRDKVFRALRKLSPAKLESKEKGNLISVITSDIELLEVFYAHTIAPIAIAIITSIIMSIILYMINPIFGIVSAVYYIVVGYLIPVISSKFGNVAGMEYRQEFAKTNSHLLESLKGIKEILLFDEGQNRLDEINRNSDILESKMSGIKRHEGIIKAFTDVTIMAAILTFLFISINLYQNNTINIGQALVAIVILSSSFGPTVALSNLSNNLVQTLACAHRLFNILDEVPAVEEVSGDMELQGTEIKVENVNFAYKA